ncbi:hypothetical protein ABT160_32915 [Streptomyces sp. NPDC001941]|uniref:hypothetical protein n=1 Tax=Streptomyces sp. NPDC001941 TaxID=3154659 RepID=UPI003332844C
MAHWLAGTLPRHPVPQLVAAALSQRLGRLVTAQDAGLTRSPQTPLPPCDTQSVEADPVRRLLNLCTTETDPERRAFLAKTAYTVGSLALTGSFASAFADPVRAAAPTAARQAPMTAAARVAQCDALVLRQMTQTFATLAERHGGAHIRAMLATYLSDQVSHLLHAPATGPLHADLLAGAAQLTHLLATMNDDSGHPGLAQRYFRTALDLSEQAQAPHLYAITLRAMSVQALRLGHPLHAHHLAEAAVDTLTSHGGPATASFLLIQRAHTHAVNGDHRHAAADLARAEDHHARADSSDDPFGYYPRAALDYQRSQTLHALGDTQQALVALQSSADRRVPEQRKSTALTEARLAELRLQVGHVEAAALHGQRFLEHYPHLHSTHADTALDTLAQHLARYPRQPQATTLSKRLRAISHTRHPAHRVPAPV